MNVYARRQTQDQHKYAPEIQMYNKRFSFSYDAADA